jgi:Cyclopropane fatty acid synthase and related methyltransferases
MEEQTLDRARGRRPSSPPAMPLALRPLVSMLSRLHIGSVELVAPGGAHLTFAGTEPGAHGVLRVKRPWKLLRYVLFGGEVGFGDAYLDDCWDSPDLARLLLTLYINEPYYGPAYEKNWFGRIWGAWQHRRNDNSRRGARRNIAYHYDLGNDFYRLWLDETMTYSGALFAQAQNESLSDAQQRKYDALIDRLDLRPEHHLLEVGCGWGGFALRAAQRSGCRVTGITLSREQLEFARARARVPACDRLQFELRDYRDVEGRYDRIASIEMYEAVGERHWPTYFNALRRLLTDDGVAAIQGITIDDAIFESYRTRRDFIQKYVFPGGMLATPRRFVDEARAAGLASEAPHMMGLDYADTLAVWHRNVLAVRDQISAMFDPRFLRLWRYYLAYCEAGFRAHKIDLMQLTLRPA